MRIDPQIQIVPVPRMRVIFNSCFGAFGLSGDALHELGLVNPRRIRIGTPKRARPRLPAHIEVIQRPLEARELTAYEGIPSATVARALLDCRGLVMGERLLEAAQEAARVGLLRKSEADRVLAELGSAA